MKAPNGAETNLTEDQWLSVRTKAFKRWFGDWEHDPEEASKVVDENGEPKVVYHGTEKDFGDVFQDVHTWEDFEDDDHGVLAPNTFWFADKKFTAQTYQVEVFVPEGETKVLEPAPHGSILISQEDTEFFFVRSPKNGPWNHGRRITAEEAIKKDGRRADDGLFTGVCGCRYGAHDCQNAEYAGRGCDGEPGSCPEAF